MTQSGFTEEIIARVANDLTLPEDGWKRRQVEKKLRELETEVPIYQRREAIRQPAKVRDQLGRLLLLCEKASPTGSKSFQERIQKIVGKCDITRALLLWQAALGEDPAQPESAIRDGRAEQGMERILKDPKALCKAAAAAREAVVRKVAHGRGGARHRSDWALEQAIILLGVLFWEVTGKLPKISVDGISGRKTGPFLQVLKLCLPPLGWRNFSDEALRHTVRQLRGGSLGQISGLSPRATKYFDSAI